MKAAALSPVIIFLFLIEKQDVVFRAERQKCLPAHTHKALSLPAQGFKDP